MIRTEIEEQKEILYRIRKDVKCIKCNNTGAVQKYGTYDELKEHMSHSFGFGGTIPYVCLNCGNVGLINFGGLEGYKKAFVKTNEKTNDTTKN